MRALEAFRSAPIGVLVATGTYVMYVCSHLPLFCLYWVSRFVHLLLAALAPLHFPSLFTPLLSSLHFSLHFTSLLTSLLSSLHFSLHFTSLFTSLPFTFFFSSHLFSSLLVYSTLLYSFWSLLFYSSCIHIPPLPLLIVTASYPFTPHSSPSLSFPFPRHLLPPRHFPSSQFFRCRCAWLGHSQNSVGGALRCGPVTTSTYCSLPYVTMQCNSIPYVGQAEVLWVHVPVCLSVWLTDWLTD